MNTTNPKEINLVPLAALDTELQMNLREIRNEENVRKWMYTDHIIGVNEHLAWINQLKKDDRQIVFVVLNNKRTPLGVVSINAIDRIHRKADWGYYLTDTARRQGMGSTLLYSFINFVFDSLGIEKLNCGIIEGNDISIKLHKKFLFQEEGFRRSDLLKNGSRISVHLLGLTKEGWLAGREEVQKKYSGVFEKFSVSIQWPLDKENAELDPIDQIEAARARNNLNWMSILRLALEKSPETAKPIVAEIKRIDREISALTGKLTAVDE